MFLLASYKISMRGYQMIAFLDLRMRTETLNENSFLDNYLVWNPSNAYKTFLHIRTY